MNTEQSNRWHEANQRYLMLHVLRVRDALKKHIARVKETPFEQQEVTEEMLTDALAALPAPSTLDSLCVSFNLSSFERDVLLLCAGVELDLDFARLCDAAQGDTRRPYPTFSLALSAFAGAHWSALIPDAPLRRARLIELAQAEKLTSSPLYIDERVLHYLTGISYLDARLRGLIGHVVPCSDLPPSHHAIAKRIIDFWTSRTDISSQVLQLCGGDNIAKYDVATFACSQLQMQCHVLRASDIPAAASEREALARLWEREAILCSSALLLDCDKMENESVIVKFVENLHGVVFVSSREPLQLTNRQMMRFDVQKPSSAEQLDMWRTQLGPLASRLNGSFDHVVSQFSLTTQGIRAVSSQIHKSIVVEKNKDLKEIVWDACRIQTRLRLDGLGQRIEMTSDWDDLVLPESQLQTLHEIAGQVHERNKVYESWGFASKGLRGLGISALFAGATGTGKTMAAEVLAKNLRLDLYRIDLSQVVSKYIGETEKNLRRVFDAAEESGAVLLFDEADALFGKRSEIRDSHDRYANIEISYLLQRMETYRGLAILTTNMKSVLDTSFLRRIRFIVQFPFPGLTQREKIWSRIFPASTPLAALDMNKLAKLNLTGGNIRNIALHAAFFAAQAGEPVRMIHILRAARREYEKLEKTLTEGEIRDWV